MSNLIIPVGIPGCGKSTWGETMFGHGKYSLVSSDEIRRQKWGSLRAAHDVTPEEKKLRNEHVWKVFYRSVEERLQHNVDVYADATNLRTLARERLLGIAALTEAQSHILLFDNIEEARTRNLERESDKIVPSDVMRDFSEQYEQAERDVLDDTRYDTITVIASLC